MRLCSRRFASFTISGDTVCWVDAWPAIGDDWAVSGEDSGVESGEMDCWDEGAYDFSSSFGADVGSSTFEAATSAALSFGSLGSPCSSSSSSSSSSSVKSSSLSSKSSGGCAVKPTTLNSNPRAWVQSRWSSRSCAMSITSCKTPRSTSSDMVSSKREMLRSAMSARNLCSPAPSATMCASSPTTILASFKSAPAAAMFLIASIALSCWSGSPLFRTWFSGGTASASTIAWRLSGRNAKLQSVVTANKSVSPKLSRRFFTTGANAPSATICSSVFPPERESRHRIFMHCSCRWPSFVPATCATCTAALARPCSTKGWRLASRVLRL
mmetsp:Transcript_57665/g.135676  ORF Transcript_57665/g.135676 Transcript_57665/m.135676 type:complete len:326 (+) Transcript_57665:330-1307(+)